MRSAQPRNSRSNITFVVASASGVFVDSLEKFPVALFITGTWNRLKYSLLAAGSATRPQTPWSYHNFLCGIISIEHYIQSALRPNVCRILSPQREECPHPPKTMHFLKSKTKEEYVSNAR